MKSTARIVTNKIESLFPTSRTKNLHRKLPGEVPGKAVHTGEQRLENVLITVHDFDEEHFDTISINKIEKSEPFLQDKSKTWIQVMGLHDIDKLKSVWEYFDLHPLVQEDIVSVSQRPKVEHYENIIFIVMRLIKPLNDQNEKVALHTEQISIVLGENYVLSFQESDDPIFDPILKRLEQKSTRLRRYGPDYLAYALMDTIVDYYFQALDLLGDSIEKVEEQILGSPGGEHLQVIHSLRRDMIYLRKSVWSLRDGVNALIRDDSHLMTDEVKIFLRDVYDHIVQVIDSIETNREMVIGLFDMYMSGLSNKMNEVMKVLTIIATIFIPLTFIAGIYGMNFDPEISPYNMPELGWYYGYPISIVVMILVTAGLVFFFKKKEWL